MHLLQMEELIPLIAVIDVAAMSLIQTLDISPRQAQAVAIAPDGTVLVADYTNSQIHVLLMNLSTGLLTDLSTAISVGSGPLNVTIGPDGQTALVANVNSTSVDVLQITAPGVSYIDRISSKRIECSINSI